MEQSDGVGSDSRAWKAAGNGCAECRWRMRPRRQVLGAFPVGSLGGERRGDRQWFRGKRGSQDVKLKCGL